MGQWFPSLDLRSTMAGAVLYDKQSSPVHLKESEHGDDDGTSGMNFADVEDTIATPTSPASKSVSWHH
jgi:hypothetical protein